MLFSTRCPHCQAKFDVPTTAIGQRVKCPACGVLDTVRSSQAVRPLAAAPAPPPPPPPPRPPAPAVPPPPPVRPPVTAAPAEPAAPLVAPPPPPPLFVPPAPPVVQPLVAPVTPGRSPARHWPVAAAAAAVVGVLALGGVVAFRPPATTEPRDTAAERGGDSRTTVASNTRPSPIVTPPPPPTVAPVPPPTVPPVPPTTTPPSREPTIRYWARSMECVDEFVQAAADLQAAPELAERWRQRKRAIFLHDHVPGLDPKKPFGAYAHPAGTPEVLVLPVFQPLLFLGCLSAVGYKPASDGDLYVLRRSGSTTLPPIEMLGFTLPWPEAFAVRIAHQYAYVTVEGNRAALAADRLFAPADVFPAAPPDFGGVVRLDAFAGLRTTVPTAVAEAKRALAGGDPAQVAFATAALDALAAGADDLLTGGHRLRFGTGLTADRAAVELTAELEAEPGTPLRKTLEAFGAEPSAFAALTDGDPAFASVVNLAVPDRVRPKLKAVVAAATRVTLQQAKGAADLTDLSQFFETLGGAVVGGRLDAAGAMFTRPGRRVVGAVAVPNGRDFDRLFRDRVAGTPDPKDRALFTFDAEPPAADGTTIHVHRQFSVGTGVLAQLFGAHPSYVAFRPTGLMWTAGDGGRGELARALACRPRPGPRLLIVGNVREIETMARLGDPRLGADALAHLTDAHPGRYRFAVEGGPALRASARFELAMLKFVVSRGLIQVRESPP